MASILLLPVVFASFSLYLYYLSMQLPSLPSTGLTVNSTALKFPSNLEELQSLALLLEHYRTNHMGYIIMLYGSAYLFKQTFAIPGSVFMNLLGGALFGQWIGFLLTCVLSASGASACFLLAKICGRSYILKYFPDQLKKIQEKIEENSDSLFFFLMFLRLFPMTPNWFLNMASPICGVPIHLFFLSVFFGLMPYNFICVQTGCLLSTLTSMDDIFSAWTMFKLFSMATAALVPGLLIKKYQRHRSNQRREIEYNEKVARLKAEIEQLEALERKVADIELKATAGASGQVEVEPKERDDKDDMVMRINGKMDHMEEKLIKMDKESDDSDMKKIPVDVQEIKAISEDNVEEEKELYEEIKEDTVPVDKKVDEEEREITNRDTGDQINSNIENATAVIQPLDDDGYSADLGNPEDLNISEDLVVKPPGEIDHAEKSIEALDVIEKVTPIEDNDGSVPNNDIHQGTPVDEENEIKVEQTDQCNFEDLNKSREPADKDKKLLPESFELAKPGVAVEDLGWDKQNQMDNVSQESHVTESNKDSPINSGADQVSQTVSESDIIKDVPNGELEKGESSEDQLVQASQMPTVLDDNEIGGVRVRTAEEQEITETNGHVYDRYEETKSLENGIQMDPNETSIIDKAGISEILSEVQGEEVQRKSDMSKVDVKFESDEATDKEAGRMERTPVLEKSEKQLLTEEFVRDLVHNVIRGALVRVKAEVNINSGVSSQERGEKETNFEEGTHVLEKPVIDMDSDETDPTYDNAEPLKDDNKVNKTFQTTDEGEENHERNPRQEKVAEQTDENIREISNGARLEMAVKGGQGISDRLLIEEGVELQNQISTDNMCD